MGIVGEGHDGYCGGGVMDIVGEGVMGIEGEGRDWYCRGGVLCLNVWLHLDGLFRLHPEELGEVSDEPNADNSMVGAP